MYEMKTKLQFVGFCLISHMLLTSAPNAAGPETIKSDSPIEILSDEAQYYNSANKAVFKGNVVATQDTLVIKTAVMEVDMEKSAANKEEHGGISKAVLTGGVDITNVSDNATSETGEYDGKTGVMILRGNVVLKQNGNIMYGDELVYSSRTGESVLKRDPKKSNSRVRAHIVPKKESK